MKSFLTWAGGVTIAAATLVGTGAVLEVIAAATR